MDMMREAADFDVMVETESSKKRLFLVDDHALMRDLLARELAEGAGIEVAGQAGSAEEALELIGPLDPDFLLVDVAMSGMDGIAFVERLRVAGDMRPVLMLTMHRDRHIAHRALEAGATGIALKQDTLESLVFAVRQTALGERYISAALLEDGLLSDKGGVASLTARERDVLALIAQGQSTQAVSGTLGLSPRTVDAHRRNIIAKTGARNAAHMTRLAISLGLADA